MHACATFNNNVMKALQTTPIYKDRTRVLYSLYLYSYEECTVTISKEKEKSRFIAGKTFIYKLRGETTNL